MSDLIEPPYVPVGPTPPLAGCRRYRPGHAPHDMQVRLASASPPEDWSPAVVMDVDEYLATLAVDDELVRLRTHDAPRLAALVRRHGSDVRWNRRHAALHLALPGGTRAVLSVQSAEEPPSPCGE